MSIPLPPCIGRSDPLPTLHCNSPIDVQSEEVNLFLCVWVSLVDCKLSNQILIACLYMGGVIRKHMVFQYKTLRKDKQPVRVLALWGPIDVGLKCFMNSLRLVTES